MVYYKEMCSTRKSKQKDPMKCGWFLFLSKSLKVYMTFI